MALPRETVIVGFNEDHAAFSALVRSLNEHEWRAPSRCDGWTVADVAAHVTGGITDVVTGKLEGLGTPEVTQREVDERKGRSPAEIADELDASLKLGAGMLASFDDAAWNGPVPVAGLPGTLGDGVEALWYDAYLHADDIRASIGSPTKRTTGLDAAVSHVAFFLNDGGWGPATLALDGMPEYEIRGGGQHITGDPHEFVLVATGRADPASFGLDETVNIYR
jgi:uncharacterized protein (TIGR03083 family)